MENKIYTFTRNEGKKTSASVSAIENHCERKKDIYECNMDIDDVRTEKNYHLIKPNEKYNDFIERRLSETGITNIGEKRIRMGIALVAASESFFENPDEKIREFFERSLEYYIRKFRKENIISAVVHMDEHVPHMHIAYVPITEDGRLCYSEFFKWPDGKRIFHDGFNDHIQEFFPEFDDGIPAGITHAEHLPMPLYKKIASIAADSHKIYEVLTEMTEENMIYSREFIIEKYSRVISELARLKYDMDNYLIRNEKSIQYEKNALDTLKEKEKHVEEIKQENKVLKQNEKKLKNEVEYLRAMVKEIPDEMLYKIKERINSKTDRACKTEKLEEKEYFFRDNSLE